MFGKTFEDLNEFWRAVWMLYKALWALIGRIQSIMRQVEAENPSLEEFMQLIEIYYSLDS